jgi:hypothetical protein
MKKNKILVPLAIALVTGMGLTGCAGEEEDIFSATAAERLNESSAKYSARLEAQPNGWAMQYYPTYKDEYPYGSGYLILMRFNPDYSVDVSMDNRFSNNQYMTDTSVWEVIKDNGPVLSFNSFNKCMHAFSDPEDIPWTDDSDSKTGKSNSMIEQGEGCGGDYEFIIVDAPEDASYMMLKGKKRNTYNLLTPIEEGVDYAEYLADVKAFHNSVFPEKERVSNLVHFGDSIYRMDGSNDGLPNIYPYEADAIANENFNPFLVTKRGDDYYLRFRDAFERDDMDGVLQELRYDKTQDIFVGTDNANFTITPFPAGQFFVDNMMADMHIWETTLAMDRSDDFTTAINNMLAELKASATSYDLDGKSNDKKVFTLRQVEGEILLEFTVTFRRSNKNYTSVLSFGYSVTNDDNSLTLTYAGGRTDGAVSFYETFPALKVFVDMFNGKYLVAGETTNFNLNTVKLTSADDANKWILFRYAN